MKTPKPCSFAALKSRAMFSTVLFSLTLAPTNPQETPFSLKTSFCGSMTTRDVSFLSRTMVPIGFLLRVSGFRSAIDHSVHRDVGFDHLPSLEVGVQHDSISCFACLETL